MDKYFRVEVIASTPNPQQVVYAALHQDYAESFVWDEEFIRLGDGIYQKDDDDSSRWPDESKCGELIIKHLLAGNKGHFGPLEHPQITFNCGWFPHSVMQQARTHRVGISFDVQSFRYTGKRLYQIGDKLQWYDHNLGEWIWDESLKSQVEKVVYIRPVGSYSDRDGKKYSISEEERLWRLAIAADSLANYAISIDKGWAEEDARGLIPFDVRQHFVVSFNLRSLMHFLQIRGKKDAQLEIQQLCELMLPHFQNWCPEIYEWFKDNLWLKGRLAP